MIVAGAAVTGCSFRDLAVDTIGDMLSEGGSAFADDDDVELVGEALPFSLKLTEGLLQESPKHRGLLRAAAQGYVLYSYAYVQFPAEKAAIDDLDRARELRNRARKLYFRALGYALRGLEIDHPGISQEILSDPSEAMARIASDADDEVPFLYWGASALGLAISVSKNDPAMLARLGEVEAMLQRAIVIDESYEKGVLHEFALTLAAAIPSTFDREAIERHYRRALELSDGKRASLFIAYAMAVPLRNQDRQRFQNLIESAVAIEPSKVQGQRLRNSIAQLRGRWLLSRMDELFLD